jgi:hypothetical protein
VGVALAAEADDRDCAALQAVEIGVFVVVKFCHVLLYMIYDLRFWIYDLNHKPRPDLSS